LDFLQVSDDMTEQKAYVHQDKFSVWRVGDTRVSLDSVAIAFDQGHSAETIQQQYPALSLEEVYGTIAFYLANQEEIREYLKKQDQIWEEERRKNRTAPNPVMERLRAQKKNVDPVRS
jgi:uncharacterized protein (DUF433 family)